MAKAIGGRVCSAMTFIVCVFSETTFQKENNFPAYKCLDVFACFAPDERMTRMYFGFACTKINKNIRLFSARLTRDIMNCGAAVMSVFVETLSTHCCFVYSLDSVCIFVIISI